MDKLTLEDLGLTEAIVAARREAVCMEIASKYDSATDQGFHIAAFLLPAGVSLPIHDHPHMTVIRACLLYFNVRYLKNLYCFIQVLSKLVSGSLEVLSFTAIGPTQATEDEAEEGIQVKQDRHEVVDPSRPAWLLSPEHGNLHRFTALSPCVIFDLLLPPYREPQRPCNYYVLREPPSSLRKGEGGGEMEKDEKGVHGEQRRVTLRLMTAAEEKTVTLPYVVRYHGYRPSSPQSVASRPLERDRDA